MNPTLTLTEDSNYFYDERAANRAIKFIETRLCHFQDVWAATRFILLPWQRKVVGDLFGWKRRDNNLRRFREAYIEIAKGNGKSPLLAAIGAYMLLADNEEGALVLSAATDHKQAQVTFNAGKIMLEESPRLSSQVHITEYEIEAPKHSSWRIVSGTVAGKAGEQPTCVLIDELWEAPNRKMYASMCRNAKKRSQSLVIIATNSGISRDTVCWELHERARRVLEGVSKEDALYPVIYATDKDDDAGSPATWAKANPALDQIIKTETLKSEWIKAQENPFEMAEFLRLHLSRWVSGADKLLDMRQWDDCSTRFSTSEVKALPLVLSLDMSLLDDLTALSFTFIGPKNLYAKCKFWLPRKTAADYEQRESVPYSQWERDGHIKLVDSETIDPQVQRRIANFIISLKDKYNLRCLTYDRNRASNVIALCEAAGVVCVPVPQNWFLSPAIEELMRRLKDKSIVIHPSPILRWNASNVEGKLDPKGNMHIHKEGAKGTYAGRRGSKHDGVSALVTGLSQVRLEQMQPTKKPSVYESRGVFCI